jgi:hypothetical protein
MDPVLVRRYAGQCPYRPAISTCLGCEDLMAMAKNGATFAVINAGARDSAFRRPAARHDACQAGKGRGVAMLAQRISRRSCLHTASAAVGMLRFAHRMRYRPVITEH